MYSYSMMILTDDTDFTKGKLAFILRWFLVQFQGYGTLRKTDNDCFLLMELKKLQ